jgi:Ca2+-binding RTX toxin-like protein
VASEAISVTIDTYAPTAPKMGIYSTSGAAVSGTTANNDFILKGTAEASSTVKIFDADKQIGTATANSSGAWSFEATDLANGGHNFTSKAMDAAGNTSSASAVSGITVSAPTSTPTSASIDFTNVYEGWNDTATIKGTANPYTQIKLLDGTQSLGSVKAGSDGSWSFKTSALSDTVHTFSAQQIDSTGRVVATSPDKAILGSTGNNTLKSTTGDDLLVGNGGIDTFVFADNFGNDTIKDFEANYAVGGRHDTIQFSKSVFDDFASVQSHASQVGQDVVISTGGNSLTLKNATLSGLDHYDFHFA